MKMINLLFIILVGIAASLKAEVPILSHKDTIEQQEFENVYKRIQDKSIPSGTSGYALVGTGLNSKPQYTLNLMSDTSGQMLIGQGSGLLPIWSTFGRVLQISTMAVTTSTQNTTGVLIFTGLQKQIMRVSTTSAVLILVSLPHMQNTTSGASVVATIFRDATNLAPDGAAFTEARSQAQPDRFPASMFTLDIPPSTSQSITYSVKFRTDGSGTAQIATGNAASQVLILVEISL